MATSNFHNVNARKVYACELEDDWSYDYLIEGLTEELETKGYAASAKIDDDELRSYPSKVVAHKEACKYMAGATKVPVEVHITAVVRSGYYSGANLDWKLDYYVAGDSINGYVDLETIADCLDMFFSPSKAKQYAIAMLKYLEVTAEQLVVELEEVFTVFSTPLNVLGTASNGETFYEKA